MFAAVIFTSFFLLQNVLVGSTSSSEEIIKIGKVPEPEEPEIPDINYDTTMRFPNGIVPYFIQTASYDSIIVNRIQTAMDLVEASSCVVFKRLKFKPTDANTSWVHFMNPEEKRECVHGPEFGVNGEIMIVIGYECMLLRFILHAVLHSIGFKDEVSHPHRDQYIRILWANIQPGYRHLFRIQQEDAAYKVVEYDPMSIMHFHDRAFSVNGAPTIVPRLPGLRIKPSEKLSQLDVMKLRLRFGHECNKRKVGALLDKCKTVFLNSPAILAGLQNDDEERPNESVEVDNVVDPYGFDNIGEVDIDDAGQMTADATQDYPGFNVANEIPNVDGVPGVGEDVNGGGFVPGEVDGDVIGDIDNGDRSVDAGEDNANGGDGNGGDKNVDGEAPVDEGDLNAGGTDVNAEGDGNDEAQADNIDDAGKVDDTSKDVGNAVSDDGTRRKLIHK